MGIASLMIVFHHLTIKVDAGLFAKAYMFLRVTGAMGVDIFLFLSAIGLNRSYLKSDGIKNFYKKRFKRIIPTYLLIVGIAYIIKYIIIGNIDIKGFFTNLCLINFWTEGTGDWYIVAILVFYLLYPIIYKTIEKYKWVGFCILMLIWVGMVLVIYLNFPTLFNNINTLLPRVPVFLFGTAVSNSVFQHKKISNSIIVIAILLNAIFLAIEAIFALQGAEIAYSFWPRFFYFPLSISFLTIMIIVIDKAGCFKEEKFLIKCFSFIGTITLEIYLLNQRMIEYCCSLFMLLVGQDNLIGIVLGNIIGIGLTILIGLVVHKILNSKDNKNVKV